MRKDEDSLMTLVVYDVSKTSWVVEYALDEVWLLKDDIRLSGKYVSGGLWKPKVHFALQFSKTEFDVDNVVVPCRTWLVLWYSAVLWVYAL